MSLHVIAAVLILWVLASVAVGFWFGALIELGERDSEWDD